MLVCVSVWVLACLTIFLGCFIVKNRETDVKDKVPQTVKSAERFAICRSPETIV